jgi:hypothetical protein
VKACESLSQTWRAPPAPTYMVGDFAGRRLRVLPASERVCIYDGSRRAKVFLDQHHLTILVSDFGIRTGDGHWTAANHGIGDAHQIWLGCHSVLPFYFR